MVGVGALEQSLGGEGMSQGTWGKAPDKLTFRGPEWEAGVLTELRGATGAGQRQGGREE